MKSTVMGLYLGFFALIGFSVYWTGSPYPLFALLLMPSYSNDG